MFNKITSPDYGRLIAPGLWKKPRANKPTLYTYVVPEENLFSRDDFARLADRWGSVFFLSYHGLMIAPVCADTFLLRSRKNDSIIRFVGGLPKRIMLETPYCPEDDGKWDSFANTFRELMFSPEGLKLQRT